MKLATLKDGTRDGKHRCLADGGILPPPDPRLVVKTPADGGRMMMGGDWAPKQLE